MDKKIKDWAFGVGRDLDGSLKHWNRVHGNLFKMFSAEDLRRNSRRIEEEYEKAVE